MISKGASDLEMKDAYHAYWSDLCKQGDPLYIPNKFLNGFSAGWELGRIALLHPKPTASPEPITKEKA